MELRWLEFVGDLGTGVNCLLLAIVVLLGVKTHRIGMVLGKRAFYAIIAFLLSCSLFGITEGVTDLYGPHREIMAFSKLASAFVSLAALTIFSHAVYHLKRLPREADAPFQEFKMALERLNEHEYKTRTGSPSIPLKRGVG